MHVLVIHGMVTRRANYSAQLQRKIVERLGMRLADSTLTDTVFRNYDFETFLGTTEVTLARPQAEFRTTAWVGTNAQRRVHLVFHELLWAPFRDVIKRDLLACFENAEPEKADGCPSYDGATPNFKRRTRVNGSIKESVMIDGLADATIILSPLGDVIRDDVDLAMCLAARRIARHPRLASGARCTLPASSATKQGAPSGSKFFVITESLGSFLLMDGQSRAAQTADDANAGFMTVEAALPYGLLNGATVFMFANQISLLGLARTDFRCIPDTTQIGPCKRAQPPESHGLFYDLAPAPAAGGNNLFSTPTTYVAFNDTDDLLGYDLQPVAGRAFPFGRLINVSVTQRAPRWFFVFKNPRRVHSGQAGNPKIIHAIVEGFSVPAAARR
ncbi:MAG: hypothetical protein ACR2L6_05230 [Gemmatimonadaceae bacterium]